MPCLYRLSWWGNVVKIKTFGLSLVLGLVGTQLQAGICSDCRFDKQQADQRGGITTQIIATDSYCSQVCQVLSSD